MATQEENELEDKALEFQWQQEELPKILAGKCWDEPLAAEVRQAAIQHSSLEGLHGPFFLGVESANCSGSITCPYPKDDPKYKAFAAGYAWGYKRWGGI